ncbi:hypothetical protein ATANTOWER_006119 [Ataeniobius toweri]|uniref:Uncharacterized protein n=1 Tax=Ataeniobius toweri TaxID=208326 RepID=A0ABU7AWT4_9TELE|nr:hypothetical protein [Ataeniobius toweri]
MIPEPLFDSLTNAICIKKEALKTISFSLPATSLPVQFTAVQLSSQVEALFHEDPSGYGFQTKCKEPQWHIEDGMCTPVVVPNAPKTNSWTAASSAEVWLG